jgi:thioredoxin:protein disulfide reductase
MRIKSPSFFGLLPFLAAAACAQIQLSGSNLPREESKEPVSIAISRNNPERADTLSLTLALQMEKHVHIYSAESLFFKVEIVQRKGLGRAAIRLPRPGLFTNFDTTAVSVYVNGQKIVITAPITAPDWRIEGTAQFQACDSRMCFTPRKILFSAASGGKLSAAPEAQGALPGQNVSQTPTVDVIDLLYQFTLEGSAGGFMNVKRFSSFLSDPAGIQRTKSGGFENKGLVIVILLILLGGIALNLTPCVLPMMPVTVAILGAGAQAKSAGRGMFVGSVYGCAMALTYGILGLVVVLTGKQFGIINSSPVFNLAVAIVFFVMALAMFDIIQVDFTRFRKGTARGGERGKLLTVFIMGIVASLLAGACVAPVVISVILYAGTLYAKGNLAGLFLPFFLGVGMALPWPFAGAGLSFLPKPGKWMAWVKYVFGVFILGMALYYGYLGVNLIRERAVPRMQSSSKTDQSSESNAPWIISLAEGLQKARNENKMVFIDFWATWCKNCKAMDATTFRDPGVEKLLGKYVLVKFQADKLDDPLTEQLFDRFRVMGLPTYVVLTPK